MKLVYSNDQRSLLCHLSVKDISRSATRTVLPSAQARPPLPPTSGQRNASFPGPPRPSAASCTQPRFTHGSDNKLGNIPREGGGSLSARDGGHAHSVPSKGGGLSLTPEEPLRPLSDGRVHGPRFGPRCPGCRGPGPPRRPPRAWMTRRDEAAARPEPWGLPAPSLSQLLPVTPLFRGSQETVSTCRCKGGSAPPVAPGREGPGERTRMREPLPAPLRRPRPGPARAALRFLPDV